MIARVTEADIKKIGESEAQKEHNMQFINDFLVTIFESYIKEYIGHFNRLLTTFEDKFEILKREIQLEHYANKKSGGKPLGTEMSMTMLTDKTYGDFMQD